MLEVTLETLQDLLANNEKVVVKVGSTACGPCKMLAPVFEKVAQETPEVVFVSNTTDLDETVVQEYGVRGVPTMLFFKDGELSHSHVGVAPKGQLEELVDALSVQNDVVSADDFSDLGEL